MSTPLKTSAEWQRITIEDLIISPDGWDRKNFEVSWHELITYDEYLARRAKSTCLTKDPPIPAPCRPVDCEVVIVNCRNREWVSKLIYSMEKAGLKKTEDYSSASQTSRTLVFSEQ